MPSVPIKNLKQYAKAIEVLTRVGGTWQGVGTTDWVLLVTEAQYKALVEANVVSRSNGDKGQSNGTKSKKNRKL